MLSAVVKPEHTRMHLETERRQDKQLNNGTNLVEISRTLLRIVARLSKTEYTESSSIQNGRQAEVVVHNDLSDPASDEDTSQG
jgi:hypothetical protein